MAVAPRQQGRPRGSGTRWRFPHRRMSDGFFSADGMGRVMPPRFSTAAVRPLMRHQPKDAPDYQQRTTGEPPTTRVHVYSLSEQESQHGLICKLTFKVNNNLTSKICNFFNKAVFF
jgi:hypothetical protein